MSNARFVLYSIEPTQLSIVRLNDYIGLDADVSYTLPQYLEDRTGEGVRFVSVSDNLYHFSDGAAAVLCQQVEAIDPKIYAEMLKKIA